MEDTASAHAVLEALYQSAPVGLGYWDAELRYRRVNRKLAEINGLPAEAHIGRTPAELLGAVGQRAEAAFRRVLETRSAIVEMSFTGETPAAPGSIRNWLASFYPVLDENGAAIGVGGVVIDVTDRQQAAEREHAALRDAENARARSDALVRAGTTLTSSMRADRVLGELVRAIVPTLADFCAVHLAREGASPALIAVAHADPASEPLARALGERQAADAAAPVGPAAVIRTGRPEINPVIMPEDLVREGVDPEERRLLAELQVHSAAILPLQARGVVIGALTLAMGGSRRSYGPDLIGYAESLAAGAALALDNMRLFAEQAEVARELQRTLLPSELPSIPGVELAARYRASGRSNQVGGDFYDVFDAPEGEWALLIGDVVGKGAAAAATTSLVRATVQAAVLRGDGPEEALRLVDEALRRRSPMQICSAVHGRLRPLPGGGVQILLVDAGHPPPLVLRRGGALEVVEIPGMLLGVQPGAAFGQVRVRLDPGDVLLLYTDGATELRGGRPERGEQTLHRTLLASAGVPLAELVERVEHQALVVSGGELRDDLALLAVGAAPPGGQ
jgi:PAS domain S-box-containing protein